MDKVRLKHLDGTDVTVEEYDRIHRFIRLLRKLSWTIDEVDKALIGLTAQTPDGETPLLKKYDICLDGFEGISECEKIDENFECPDFESSVPCEITPDFLHQLVAVKKLLEKTGLSVLRLLTFWTKISIVGEKSLYKNLFLKHNLLGIDKVFKADNNGNYLTGNNKISQHIPVLMAAFNLKAVDIEAIIDFMEISDDLTLANVSVLFRVRLLAKILHVRIDDFAEVLSLFGNPFKNADDTLGFIKKWEKMEDAGFKFWQLNYIIRGHDDTRRPLSPTTKSLLQLTMTLYDGLNAIDEDHPDLINDAEATVDITRVKTSLLFDQPVVEQIINLLEGTTVYNTNAPSGLEIDLTGITKLKYNKLNEAIQVTGILTDEEKIQYKTLSNNPGWTQALDRIGKQPVKFFADALYAIFPDSEEAKQTLLQGDVNIPPDKQDPDNPIPPTAIIKRVYFLKNFLPFLRQRLTHRFLVDTLSASINLSNDVTDVLISKVLVDGDPVQPIINIFSAIKDQTPQGENGWKGYLIPAADENYTFVIENETQPAPLKLDGLNIILHQQDDPSNVWLSDPVKLKGRQSYLFEVAGIPADLKKLSWKTPTSPRSAIPSSVLFPDYSAQSIEDIFKKLQKTALLISGFNLNEVEIEYFRNYASDFDDLDFNAFTLVHWLRMQTYTKLRDSLPNTDSNLIEFFSWAHHPDDAAKLTEKIEALTNWEKEKVKQLITSEHYNLDRPDAFLNEQNLRKLQKAVQVADKIGMDIDSLFNWAKPISNFWVTHKIAEGIHESLRARYLQEDWEQVVKPLNDKLRENQKQALINYLLVQQDLIAWGVIDANSLFEFFLIDVQMESCMETSRIKQAISSVQLFVQRCFLGLEENYGVPNEILDRDRWEWMQRYRVWEVNRKVFLYPENWIEPNLRDDKSPFFKELESELLQKDINKQTVEDALKSYLYKVDEVANMRVVGLFIDNDNGKLHVFSRTRNAPYFFNYRYFDMCEKNWYPWEKMQVDIPSYDVEGRGDDDGKIIGNGTYLVPAVCNKRLLIFFPQFLKKTRPKKIDESFKTMGNSKVQERKPDEIWEIKMAWSEYRNRKWTQKQVSTNAVYQGPPFPYGVENIPTVRDFEFAPEIGSSNIIINIFYHYCNGRRIDGMLNDAFEFKNNSISIVEKTLVLRDLADNFHYKGTIIHSLQASSLGFKYLTAPPYFDDQSTEVIFQPNGATRDFYHPFTHDLLGKVELGILEDFFAHNLEVSSTDEAFGEDDSGNYHELKRAYSIYNWELFFHLPTMLADHLSKSQQFEEAMKWYHFVFNPYANDPANPDKRFWRFFPFKATNAKDFLISYFNSLQPNQSDAKIAGWRDNPFRPHYIARDRPASYMKWVVMKYLDNLITWADYLFRQHTIETINQATQLYILAGHILGTRPQVIPKRGKIKPQTYYSLLDKWDAFSNTMVELELVFPFSSQTPLPVGIDHGVAGFANIFGFASSLYFCLPDNPKLLSYWNTIENRLTKIRSCLDIEGVFRIPALYEPPIDPALLVQATAHGISLSSVLNDLNTSMPNYRFNYLVQKALELCNELKSLGNALLSALEKKDAEVLSKMRAKHDSSIQNLVMEVRKQQLDEAHKSLDALYQNRKSPEYRLRHYLELIGEDLNNVPSEDADFAELPNQMEQVIDESGLKLIPYEKEEIDKASAAADWQIAIGVVETLASILHAIPSVGAHGTPLGVGGSVKFGGPHLGSALQGVARGMQTYASNFSFQSTSASRKGGFLRQLQDRVQQANLAGLEIKQIDKQIISQKIRISIAEQEITNQQKQIDNAQEVEEFLKSKYTNEELYLWMEGAIRTLYYQTYTLAYDLAKKAEKVFLFERGLTNSNFIQFGYWDSTRDGLLAGERLYVGLKQLEAAFQEKRGHDYEITKHVSLRQTNPLALFQLKETGKCEFGLPEVLFDMDFPGHYLRRTKSVAISIPCVAGPYTSMNCTVRLLENKFRINAIATDKNDYLEKTDETDNRFTTVNIPITSIAVSTGQNDSGVFELNFQDERYMPFEGAGVISKWRLELPSSFRQFDYDTITDVIMHIRYTSKEGGEILKNAANDSLLAYIKSVEELSKDEGLFTAFDLKHDFPNEWHKAIETPPAGNERILDLKKLNERLPVFTKGRDTDDIVATDITLVTSSDFNAANLFLLHDGGESNFTDGVKIGDNNSFVIREKEIPVSNWQIKILDTQKEINKIWLVVRYILK